MEREAREEKKGKERRGSEGGRVGVEGCQRGRKRG